MSRAIWIQGGRVVEPKTREDSERDLFILDGKIVSRPDQKTLDNADVIDAEGLVVCPGFIDMHAHFRVPGQSHKETIHTGTCAAAAGGFTSVVCMPNSQPPADSAGTIQYIKDAIKREAVVNVFPTGCITVGMKGERLAPAGSLRNAGAIALSDGGNCVQSAGLMRRAAQYAHMFDLPLIDHCEDYSLTEGAVMHEGFVSTKLGLIGSPSSAEEIMVSRNIILSSDTGAHIHLQHISSKAAVEIIRRAKARGVNVTAEATPHHIALTDEEVSSFDTNFKMKPPLREEADRLALLQGLGDGTIDCLATGHAPHSDYEKDVEFDYAPVGIIGLETALSVTLQQLYRSDRLSLAGALSLLTNRPAEILNLPKGTLSLGADADVTLFNPDEVWTPRDKGFFSKSSNSPWIGRALPGKVKMTIVGGRVVFDGERINAPAKF